MDSFDMWLTKKRSFLVAHGTCCEKGTVPVGGSSHAGSGLDTKGVGERRNSARPPSCPTWSASRSSSVPFISVRTRASPGQPSAFEALGCGFPGGGQTASWTDTALSWLDPPWRSRDVIQTRSECIHFRCCLLACFSSYAALHNLVRLVTTKIASASSTRKTRQGCNSSALRIHSSVESWWCSHSVGCRKLLSCLLEAARAACSI
mmetsp:Transcript_93152/g.279449  ORF Transcript_93152/g.279449 Transcript_93152/m.279449 type:complete len:205 (-) Transcript_93152:210-824(-)